MDYLLNKNILPFVAVIITYVILAVTRWSIFVNPSTDPVSPFCLNTFKTTILLALVGFGVYYLMGHRFSAQMCGMY